MDKTVGVLGGGQLGRMFLEAANRLNIRVHVLADAESAPAKQISAHSGHVAGGVTNPVAVKHLASSCDVLTIEIEHVDTEVLEEIAAQGGLGDDVAQQYSLTSRQTRESGGGNGNGHGIGDALRSGGLGGLGQGIRESIPGMGSSNRDSKGKGIGNGLSKTTTGTTSSSSAIAGPSSAAPTPPRRCAVHPSWRSIRTIQDKFQQKAHLAAHGLPGARSVEVDPLISAPGGPRAAIERAVESAGGFPAMLKARTGAYDGRGNYLLRSAEDVLKGAEALKDRPLYVEEYAPFIKELAVMVVKVDARAAAAPGEDGDGDGNGNRDWREWTLAYPVVETVHEDGVCSLVYAPARDVEDKVRKKAQNVARKAVATFWGKGIFGVEMFLMPNGKSFSLRCSLRRYRNHG